MGPGRNPQYTRAHSGGEAVGCSQCHVTTSSRMVAEQAVPSSTGREPRPSHQNQQWTVQLCNTASFLPAAQTVQKIVEIRKNRVQKTVRGTQVKLINEVDTTRSRRDQRQGFSEPRVAGRGGVPRQAQGDEELKLGRLVEDEELKLGRLVEELVCSVLHAFPMISSRDQNTLTCSKVVGQPLLKISNELDLCIGARVDEMYPTEQELLCDSEVCAIGLKAARRILDGVDAILATTRAKVSARKLEAEAEESLMVRFKARECDGVPIKQFKRDLRRRRERASLKLFGWFDRVMQALCQFEEKGRAQES